jgi:hypothetical protein
MEIYPIDDRELLFISPAIEDWRPLYDLGISVIIDMEGGIDDCIPTVPNTVLYLYFPIEDAGLPDLHKLYAVAIMGASLVKAGHKVLSHCGLGFNRSALVAGLILIELGMSGEDAIALLRAKRPGALFNEIFADYLRRF